jgi:UDP-N-acetylglucosamine transferase subunit ALG13
MGGGIMQKKELKGAGDQCNENRCLNPRTPESSTPSSKRKINVALVCTQGGHFEQMTNLSDFYNCYNHFWITNRTKQTESHLKGNRTYYIETAHFKKLWRYLYQMPPVLKIFAEEKPTHVLSTGSGRTALIPFLLSRLFNVKFIYIDTFSRVHGYSKFGTFLLKTGNKIYTQWEDPQNENAIYIGPIFKQQGIYNKDYDVKYVFVTVGTRDEPFTRMLKGIEDLVRKGKIREKVIIQAGHTKYSSECVELFDFCVPEMIDELIKNARYVITQESAGIGTQCLKHGTRFIVMPRDYQYGELPTKSDMKEDLHYKLEELGYTKVVRSKSELEKAIENIDKLKVGFNFDNSLAIKTLKEIIETGSSSQ